MNRISIISAFLGGVKNRYMTYNPERSIREKIEIAAGIDGVDGLELCYPQDFRNPAELKLLMESNGLAVSAVNTRSRRQDRWIRGSFTSEDPKERAEVVDDFKRAMDVAQDFGTHRITTCPLNDGHDYVFEMDYLAAYDYAADSFHRICAHDPKVTICIEYKPSDPRVRCLLGSAGETLALCQAVGADNLGVTLDFGHSILAGERPAQAAAMLHKAKRLSYVHLNDNDRAWDWDMLPGAFNLVELIEFFFYLKEVDTGETFDAVVRLTRKIEGLADRIDRARMKEVMKSRNPVRALMAMYDMAF